MTNNQLTDERLVKILSETQTTIMEHNSRCVRGSVEVDARLFESMIMELQVRRKTDNPPVHPTVASEKLDDETLQELIEFRRTTFEYNSKEGNKVQTIIHGVTLSALRELQKRRNADSNPVCFVSERNLATLTKYRAAVKVKAEPVMVRPVALYRHAQPVPVVRLPAVRSATEYLYPVAVYPAGELEEALIEQGVKLDAERRMASTTELLKRAAPAAFGAPGNGDIPQGS